MDSQHSFEGQTFRDASFTGARFVSCDLTGVVVRGSEIASVEIDSPWLIKAGNTSSTALTSFRSSTRS
ncbi:pentapeptide repeat-containing protein [Flaviflexus salsibiostraticola]|uniref:pentapeptide repeat-containing protein n=1 Tax=Flaviflexus salsibiostraticola TaxID=1282737 RepID=UPI001B87BA4F|nr:pentapeptide repeat-containing protein [Flaviflexus salsibiostraticola]